MLVLAGVIHHLRDLCLRYFIGEDPANPDALLVDVEHDARRIFQAHLEKALERVDDELHRRVIIVEHQHLIGRWLFRFGPRLGRNAEIIAAVFIVALVGHHWAWGESVAHVR
jgi:hypothetical protein